MHLYGDYQHIIYNRLKWHYRKLDYIGFGPVYPTPTKEKPDPTVGTELLQKAVTMSSIPVVAIGGINEKNIEAVLKAGARNIALVRYFMQHNNLRERIKTILETCKHYWR